MTNGDVRHIKGETFEGFDMHFEKEKAVAQRKKLTAAGIRARVIENPDHYHYAEKDAWDVFVHKDDIDRACELGV